MAGLPASCYTLTFTFTNFSRPPSDATDLDVPLTCSLTQSRSASVCEERRMQRDASQSDNTPAHRLSSRNDTFTATKPCSPQSLYRVSASAAHTHAITSGGASAVKEPVHFEVRKSSSQVTRSQGRSQDFTLKEGHRSIGVATPNFLWGALFPFLVVALKTQAANAADCFTVKIKQIKRSDMVTFFSSVHTISEAKQ